MKTNNQMNQTSKGWRYAAIFFTILLTSTFIIHTASAQRRGERSGRDESAVRNGADRGGTRQEGAVRGRDVSIERNNPSRGFNHNQTPVRIDRNRGNSSPVVRNAEGNRNPARPSMEGNRNPNFRPGGTNRPIVGSVNRPGYRPVYGNDRRPHYNPHNPAWGYGYLPRRNSYFYSLPANYFSINFGGIGYRYWDGVFYRPYNNLFSVIAPPVGIYINVLPVGYRRIYVRERPYYYFNGTYYDQRDANYYVVSPPVGAVVESLPAGYETVVIDGETFYTADGAQYKPTVQQNGEIWYEVIKAN